MELGLEEAEQAGASIDGAPLQSNQRDRDCTDPVRSLNQIRDEMKILLPLLAEARTKKNEQHLARTHIDTSQ